MLQILEAEIDVLSTLNIQHVESMTPRVQSLTGITVRETVPDWVLDRADEMVLSRSDAGGADDADDGAAISIRRSGWSGRWGISSAAAI